MGGDYSRWSFDPARHFAGLLMEQGRVHTDADWNEWVSAVLRRLQAGTLDTVGRAVVPRETPNAFLIKAVGGALTIGPGRMYVDGLLAENHGIAPIEWDPRLAEQRGSGAIAYDAQPYLPNAPALPAGGRHLAYLKVWQSEVTAIEDPRLIEPALGVDTSTRLQTVWQVRVLPNVGADATCATALADIPGFTAAEPAAAGRLSTGTADVPGEPDPCLVPPSGDYKGENQLYRVEIHRSGDFTAADRATFKWSRDNATVASRVTHIPALDRIVVESIGPDQFLNFSDGDWVEVTDDWRECAGLPGEMRRIRTNNGVDPTTRTLLLDSTLPAGMFPVNAQGATVPARNTRVRRWDQSGKVRDANGNLLVDLDAPGSTGTIPVQSGATSVLLENGVVVRFGLAPATGRFRTGDYWNFAARSADASVEILTDAPPRGIHAHYAKLAYVTFPDTEDDCRTLWPPEDHDGGCDCSVCVSVESHASGRLTIQMAIEQVKVTGGTVCLGVGTYLLREPLRVDGGRSIRIKGQGIATVLMAPTGGGVIAVASTVGITIEHLAMVSVSLETSAPTIRLANCVAARLRDAVVANLSLRAGRGAALTIDGYLIASAVERCALVGHTGIAGGGIEKSAVTAGLQIENNWIWATHRGIDLSRRCVHLLETRISANTVLRCREFGFLVEGGNTPSGGFNITRNTLGIEGVGIRAGIDGLRIVENDIFRSGGTGGDGVVIAESLDPRGVGRCQLLANRIHGVAGHGIVIRTNVTSGMIKHNIISETGGGGIVMEEGGSAGVLVVENNQLLETAVSENVRGEHPAAIRMVRVNDLDILSNAIHGFARQAQRAETRTGISCIAVGSARIRGNTLSGIAPASGFVGQSFGIDVIAPFLSASISDNTLRRRGANDGDLKQGEWIAIQTRRAPAGFGGHFVLHAPTHAFVVSTTHVFAFVQPRPGDVSVQGNDVAIEASAARPVILRDVVGCRMIGNRIVVTFERTPPSHAQCARGIFGNNEFRGVHGLPVLEVEMLDKPVPQIIGNVCTGAILAGPSGSLTQLVDPWKTLNSMP